MNFHEISELEKAHEISDRLYKSIRNTPGISAEDRLMKELSAIVSEGIHYVQTNEEFESSCFSRIHYYLAADAETPLFQLGYALTILLEKLLTDKIILRPENKNKPRAPVSKTIRAVHNVYPSIFTMSQPSTSAAANTVDKDIKEEPLDESDEIKLEPITDEIKQEESPMVDVFCPTTGSVRKFDSMNGLPSLEERQAANDRHNTSRNSVVNSLLTATSSTPGSGLPRKCIAINAVRICAICDKKTDKYYAAPAQKAKKAAFLQKIRVTTADEVRRLANLYNTYNHAYICLSHYRVNAEERAKEPDNYVLPPVTIAKAPQIRVPNISKTAAEIVAAASGKPIEKEGISADNLVRRCNLCNKITDDSIKVPFKSTIRPTVLARIIASTVEEGSRLAEIYASSKDAYFCLAHIGDEPQLRTVKDITQRCAPPPPPDCDLCKEPKYPCRLTPKNQFSARRFFDNLLGLTVPQRETVDWFLKNPSYRANICQKHIKAKNRVGPYIARPDLDSADTRKRIMDAELLIDQLSPKRSNTDAFIPSGSRAVLTAELQGQQPRTETIVVSSNALLTPSAPIPPLGESEVKEEVE